MLKLSLKSIPLILAVLCSFSALAADEITTPAGVRAVGSDTDDWKTDGPRVPHYCYLYVGGDISGRNVPQDKSPIREFLVMKAASHTAGKPVLRLVLNRHPFEKLYVTTEQVLEFPASVVDDYYMYDGKPYWKIKNLQVNFYANAVFSAFGGPENKAIRYTLVFKPAHRTGMSIPAELPPTDYGFLRKEGTAGFDCHPTTSSIFRTPEWAKKYLN